MYSSCASGDRGHLTSSARGQRLNLLSAGLLIAAGLASAALGLSSLLRHDAERATSALGSGSVLGLRGRDLLSRRPLSAALQDRPVIVELWSRACPGCREVAANLERLEPANRSALVGIDVGDTAPMARMLARDFGWRRLSAADPSGRYARTLGLRTLPTTLLLDERHRIVLQIEGVHGLATLERRFKQLG